jgi:hypothetical protein
MMRRSLFASLLLLAACQSAGRPTDDEHGPPPPPPVDAPAACVNLAGTWVITGVCGGDVCAISQTGCAITELTCTSGAHSTSGSIFGEKFQYVGESGAGIAATCNGTVTGDEFTVMCTTAFNKCIFNGARQ